LYVPTLAPACHKGYAVGKGVTARVRRFGMITRIRDVRKAKGLTLAEVAERCDPPTTAQTIGRLETGTRTVSVGWLNRIAKALGVEAADLVRLPDRADIPVVAVLGHERGPPPR